MQNRYTINDVDDLVSIYEQQKHKSSQFYSNVANYIKKNCNHNIETVDLLVNEMMLSLKEFSCISDVDYLPQSPNSTINVYTGNITGKCSSKAEFLFNYYRNFIIQYISILNIPQTTILLSAYIFRKYYHESDCIYNCLYCNATMNRDKSLNEKNCHSWMANIREIVMMIIYICNKLNDDDAETNLTGVHESIQLFHSDIPIICLKNLEILILHSIQFDLFTSEDELQNYKDRNLCEMVIGVIFNNPKCHNCQKHINYKERSRIPTIPRKFTLDL